jgi:hypothetical protein
METSALGGLDLKLSLPFAPEGDERRGFHVSGHAIGPVGEEQRHRSDAGQGQLVGRLVEGHGLGGLDEQEIGLFGLLLSERGFERSERRCGQRGHDKATSGGHVRLLGARVACDISPADSAAGQYFAILSLSAEGLFSVGQCSSAPN